MRDSDWICKRCGSSDVIAEIERSRTTELSGRIRDDGQGRPRFDEDFPSWDDDYDVTEYVCECGASHWKLEELVVRRRAYNERRLPCGRCDHAAHEHPAPARWVAAEAEKRGLTRPALPCAVWGCDCHDYYDVALGIEPSWGPPQREVLVEGA